MPHVCMYFTLRTPPMSLRDRRGHHPCWDTFLKAGWLNSFLCRLMVRAKPKRPQLSSLDTALPKIQPPFPTAAQKQNGAPSQTGCSWRKRNDLPVSFHTYCRTWICHRLWSQRDTWCCLIFCWLIFHLKWGQWHYPCKVARRVKCINSWKVLRTVPGM